MKPQIRNTQTSIILLDFPDFFAVSATYSARPFGLD